MSRSTAGDFFGLHADDQTKRFDATNIVDQLESKGLTWATYQQGLPAVGSTVDQAPATGSGLYVRKHNPFALFTDVLASPARVQNFKPIESLATDLNSGNAPNFAFIAPDQCHDMHGVSPPSSIAYGMPWCGYPAELHTEPRLDPGRRRVCEATRDDHHDLEGLDDRFCHRAYLGRERVQRPDHAEPRLCLVDRVLRQSGG